MHRSLAWRRLRSLSGSGSRRQAAMIRGGSLGSDRVEAHGFGCLCRPCRSGDLRPFFAHPSDGSSPANARGTPCPGYAGCRRTSPSIGAASAPRQLNPTTPKAPSAKPQALPRALAKPNRTSAPIPSGAAPNLKPIATALTVAALMVRESRSSYYGSCGCPDDRYRGGRRCGGRSAYSRAGGRSLYCYVEDVPQEAVRRCIAGQ